MQAGGQGGYSRDEEKVREATCTQASIVTAALNAHNAVHSDEEAHKDGAGGISNQNCVMVGLNCTAS